MSAGRSASTLLFALVSTIVLFAVFSVVINLSALSKYSYDPGYGWQAEKATGALRGICDRPLTTKGFPLTTRRPAKDDPSGCLDETNTLAKDINLALCFSLAAIVSVGEASIIKNMRS